MRLLLLLLLLFDLLKSHEDVLVAFRGLHRISFERVIVIATHDPFVVLNPVKGKMMLQLLLLLPAVVYGRDASRRGARHVHQGVNLLRVLEQAMCLENAVTKLAAKPRTGA